jgi:hypothetical protein
VARFVVPSLLRVQISVIGLGEVYAGAFAILMASISITFLFFIEFVP